MTTARRRTRQPKSQGEDTAPAQDYRSELWRMADALRRAVWMPPSTSTWSWASYF